MDAPTSRAPRHLTRWRILLPAGVLLAALATVLALMIWDWELPPETLKFEAGKALLQVVVVSVTGIAVAIVAGAHQQRSVVAQRAEDRDREARANDRALLSTLLVNATATYNGAKRARRLLRAQAQDDGPAGYRIRADVYDRELTAINDRQLELESLSHHVAAAADGLFADRAAVKGSLDTLEKELHRLIEEFEEVRPTFSGTPPRCEFRDLPRLDAFLNDPEAFKRVSRPFHRLEGLLLADLRRFYSSSSSG